MGPLQLLNIFDLRFGTHECLGTRTDTLVKADNALHFLLMMILYLLIIYNILYSILKYEFKSRHPLTRWPLPTSFTRSIAAAMQG